MLSARVRWTIVFAVWAAVGGLLTLELYLSLQRIEPNPSLGWVAFGQFMRVLLWAAFTPGVFWVQRHCPITPRTALWSVPMHLGLSVVAMGLIYVVRLGIARVWDDKGFTDFWGSAVEGFYSRNLIDVPIYWTVFGASFTFDVVRRNREHVLRATQLEKDVAQAEVKALRAQLHPHFLFNTLNTISVLVRDGQNPEAVSLLAKLSSLLRLSLDSTSQLEVSLRHELEFLRRYLEIQQVRFPDRLEVRLAIEPAALDAVVPNLLLQPLVENAVIHGFSGKTGRGRVEITAEVIENRLRLRVADDGPGFANSILNIPPAPRPDEADSASPRTRTGIGLSNTRGRLAHVFGTEARLDLRNAPGGGAEAVIEMPFRRAQAAAVLPSIITRPLP